MLSSNFIKQSGFIQNRKADLKELKYLAKHKLYVYEAGRELGLPRTQLLMHDWSKFKPSLWVPYRNEFFNGKVSKADQAAFDVAKLKHFQTEKHHLNRIGKYKPMRYKLESLADSYGLLKAKNKNKSFPSFREWLTHIPYLQSIANSKLHEEVEKRLAKTAGYTMNPKAIERITGALAGMLVGNKISTDYNKNKLVGATGGALVGALAGPSIGKIMRKGTMNALDEATAKARTSNALMHTENVKNIENAVTQITKGENKRKVIRDVIMPDMETRKFRREQLAGISKAHNIIADKITNSPFGVGGLAGLIRYNKAIKPFVSHINDLSEKEFTTVNGVRTQYENMSSSQRRQLKNYIKANIGNVSRTNVHSTVLNILRG